MEGSTDCGHNPCKHGYMTSEGYCQDCPRGEKPVCNEDGDKWSCQQGASSKNGLIAILTVVFLALLVMTFIFKVDLNRAVQRALQ